MEYRSILFDQLHPPKIEFERAPSPFIHDIHMDQIIQDMLRGKDVYQLEPLFYTKLERVESIRYRSAIMQEIDASLSVHSLAAFSHNMRKVREYMQYSQSFPDKEQQMKWLLDAAHLYCQAMMELHQIMSAIELQSQGLKHVYEWLTHYIRSTDFASLSKDTHELHQTFNEIQFSVTIADGKIKLSTSDDDQDYCKTLSSIFLHRQHNEEHVDMRLSVGLQLSDIEKDLLNMIRKHNPKPFHMLQAYYAKHQRFIALPVMTFDREIQFYVTSLQFFQSIKNKGFAYCYPTITETNELHMRGGYDLSLASSKLHTGQAVIGNSFDLESNERVCVLTGPNQGGKTTFARSLGQIFHLSSIGCPVPCQEAALFEFDRIFTHFPSQEQPGTSSGKLKDELLRLKPILENATSRSVVLLNELFFTTTTHDAYTMGSRVLQIFLQRGTMCLYVTHVFELALSHDTLQKDGFASLICTGDHKQIHVIGLQIIRVRLLPQLDSQTEVGIAQLMMQCGMFVPATSFQANLCDQIFTHFTQEEDETMSSGKLDEELARLDQIIDHLTSRSLLLMNEPFASTTEREGSAIAKDLLTVCHELRLRVCIVTHFYELANWAYEQLEHTAFLSPTWTPGDPHSYKLSTRKPSPTSYGDNLYARILTQDFF